MNKNKQALIDLIRCVINKQSVSIPADTDWRYVYSVARAHGVCNIVYYGIKELKIELSDELREKFEKEATVALMKEATMSYMCERVLKLFEEQGVYAAPLKGYFLKDLYPTTDMRTMCDVDILIRQDKLETARNIMEQIGFPICEESEHEVVYKKPPYVSIELHKMLLKKSTSEKLYVYYENIWDKLVSTKNNEYIKAMNNEDFYIYMIVHIAKHYLNGGTGLRNILDIFVFNKKCTTDKNYLQSEFDHLGLSEFRKTAEDLANYWFGGEPTSNIEAEIMSEYILSGGAYGNIKFAKAAYAIKKCKGNAQRAQYKWLVNVLFPKYENMVFLYPELEKKPAFLPYYWIKRLISKLFSKKRKVILDMSNVSKDNIDALKKHFDNLDLKL